MSEPRYAKDNALDQTDEDDFTVSDEALEHAGNATSWAPMLTGVATICNRGTVVARRRSGSSAK